ncbi:MAG: class I SAM-dependent methyltransferase [Proteobacteria bacterium]|nr:class I SAM-dependent methyltransferase [Pseudomonadota bacterium]
MAIVKYQCPCCKSINLKNLGLIPTSYYLGDIKLDCESRKDRFLFRCLSCNLCFVWSELDYSILEDLYKNLNPTHWDNVYENRADWIIAKNFIFENIRKDASILDLGCWDGKFLDSLNGYYNRYGIELNPYAAELAEKRGIKIIENNFLNIRGIDNRFDVITLFDVIEHVSDPLSLLLSLKEILKPKGIILLSTGDSEYFLWKRIYKNRYYYCSIIEHISFINLKWINFVCSKLDFEILYIKKFSHNIDLRVKVILRNFLQNLIFLISQRFYYYLRNGNKETLEKKTVPDLFNVKDHLLIILKNKGASDL